MSETPTPGTVSISPWWVLLIIPIGLLAGWAVAVLPIPVSATKTDTRPRGAPVAAPSESAPRNTARHRRPVTEDGESESQPALQNPTQEPQRAEISQWTTLESAMAESRRNGKPVLIDFNAEWCPPCQRMKQQVFDDGRRGEAVQTAVIPVSIVDRARENGSNPPEIESLQRQYQVEAFPTLVVFSPATGRSLSKRGFGDPEATLAWITQAAQAVR
jgi:thiol-disulfide isomerase/thioredoxin